MTSETAAGTVATLWRFPVKSMGGEPLDQAELTAGGLIGDRAYALIETGSGRVVSAKSVKFFPGLLQCSAAFVAPPETGREIPPVRITLPGGAAVTSGTRDADRALSAHFGREVTLARAEPRAGAFFDLSPMSVITTSTLDHLNGIRPQSRFDPRRFRMNVIVRSAAPGFPENGWLGRVLAIGEGARVRVTVPDSRCVMTTLAQGDLPNDVEILRTLTQHNRLPVGGGESPCAGVYAVVEAPGAIRAGDRVTLV